MADGTIIIDTKIDNSGAKIGLKEMGKSLKRIEKSFDGISKSSLSANNNIEKSFSKQNEAIKKQEILLESLKGKYAAITSGSSAEKKQSGIEKQLQSVQKEITKTEQEYNALIQKLKSLEAVQNAGNPVSQAQTKSDISKLDNSIMITGERLDELHRKASVIEKDLKSLKMNPENSEEAKKLKSEIELATQKLQRLKNEAKEDFTDKPMKNISKKVNESTNRIGKSIGHIGTRIRGLILSAALFSVLYKAFNSLFTYMRTAMLTNVQFSSSLSQIKGNLLTAFQPIYEAVMPALNAFMRWLAKATSYIAAFISAIFGKSVVASKKNAQSLYNQIKAYGDTGKAAKKAGKEIEDASKSMANFDELNIIDRNKEQSIPDTGTSSGGGGITPNFGFENEIDTSNLEKALSALSKAFEPLRNMDLTKLNAGLERLKEAVKPLTKTIFDGLFWGIENVFVPLSVFTIQDVLPRFLDTLAIAIKGVGVLIKEKIEFFKQFVDQFLKPIAEYAAPGFLQFWDEFNVAFDDLVTAIENSTAFEDLRSILEKIYGFLAPIIGFLIRIGTWFASFVVSAAFIGLKKKFEDLEDKIGLVADILRGDFSGAWEHFKDLMVDNKIDAAKEGLKLLQEKFGELKETVKGFVTDWAEKIDTMVNDWKTKIKDWWDNHVSPWFTAEKWDTLFKQIGESIAWAIVGTAGFVERWKTNIENWWNDHVSPWFTKEKWNGIFQNIKDSISEKWNDVVTWWDVSLPDWWNNHVMKWFDKQTWLDLGTDIKNGFVEGFKGIINSVGGTINKLISGFQSLANGAIRAVNKVIEGYNSVADKTFLPKISTISQIDLSGYKIPMLAQGSVVPPNREFLALLGDNKKETEIVSPLSTMKQALAEVMEELGGAGGNTVVLELDGREVGRVFLPLIRKEERRKGVQLGGAY